MQIANPVYLDLETTGLDPAADEILEIGILADDGTVLLDSLVRPIRHRTWPRAQTIHVKFRQPCVPVAHRPGKIDDRGAISR